MLPRIALTALVAGTLLTTLMPVAGLAANRGGNSGGRGNGGHAQSSRGGNRGVAMRGSGEIRRSEGRSFVSPARGYSRGYIAPRSYGRPVYRGYYGSGVYLGIGAPYGYAYGPSYYDPGYAYDPAYSYGPAPAPQQACVPGSYDRNGNWIPNPNCSNPQQQYAPPQQNYNYDQQQYPQQYSQQPPQQNYNYDQQQYPQQYPQQYQQQPSYDPNQRQGYSR
jgi:hypothetical protein